MVQMDQMDQMDNIDSIIFRLSNGVLLCSMWLPASVEVRSLNKNLLPLLLWSYVMIAIGAQMYILSNLYHKKYII